MAKTLTKDKAAALASEYVCNGFNKSQALRALNYSKNYCSSTAGSKLFDKPIVREAVAEIMRRNAAAVDVTIAEIVRGFRQIAFPPEGVKVNNSDRNQALAHLAKWKNMFADRLLIGQDKQSRELSEHQSEQARKLGQLFNLMELKCLTVEDLIQMAKSTPAPFTDNEILEL